MTTFAPTAFSPLRFARAFSVLFVLAGSAAAATTATAQDAPAPTTLVFANTSVLNVDATSLDLKLGAPPPQEYPHMNYRSQVRYEDGARTWAATHFKLTGSSVNTLRITVQKGDIVEKLLPVKKGIKGWFTKDQAAEYIATLELEVAIVDPNGNVLSTASGKSQATRTVTEGATDADKQQVWTGLIIKTFDNLDAELQPQLRSAMANYIR